MHKSQLLNDVHQGYKVLTHPHMGISVNGGFPNSWLVYFMENPIQMDDLRLPPFVETPIKLYK